MRVLIPSSVSNTNSALATIQGNNLATAAGFVSLEPNYLGSIVFTPNDPGLSLQPNLTDDTSFPFDDS